MIVSADLFNQYQFRPSYTELKAILRVFGGLLIPNGDHWTFKAYKDVESATIKDAIYYDYTAEKTRSFDNKQQFLTGVRHCVNTGTGEIINCSEGLIIGGGYRYTSSELGYTANHIPQLFALTPTAKNPNAVLTGFMGVYDFNSKLFRGQMTFGDITELWNV